MYIMLFMNTHLDINNYHDSKETNFERISQTFSNYDSLWITEIKNKVEQRLIWFLANMKYPFKREMIKLGNYGFELF